MANKEKILGILSSLFMMLSFLNLVSVFFVGHYSEMGLLSFGVLPIIIFTEINVLNLYVILLSIASIFPLIAFIFSYMHYKINNSDKRNLIISVVLLSWQIISILTYVLMYIFK
tara:strand:+ start:316 stop:657 length:342 start_codon:yes stop_codon:yes gene_type:complete